jgi:molecular chaperone HtpG
MDAQYLAALEHYRPDVKFIRVDAGVSEVIKEDFPSDITELSEDVISTFKKISCNDNLNVTIEALKNEEVPAVISVSEESRRMQDMMKLYALGGDNIGAFPLEYTLTLNNSSHLCQKLITMINQNDPQSELIASYIFKLSLLSQRKLSADEMNAFLNDCYKILELI